MFRHDANDCLAEVVNFAYTSYGALPSELGNLSKLVPARTLPGELQVVVHGIQCRPDMPYNTPT